MLETEIKKLTEAVVALTDKMEGGAAKSGSGSGKAPAKKAETKKGPTAEEVVSYVTDYLKKGDSEDRKEAAENVTKVVKHFGAERFTMIDADSLGKAMELLKSLRAGDTPEELEDGSSDNGESLV